MSTNTTNYNLVKPALTDAADITAMNGNWDTIDTQLKSVNDKVNAIPVAIYTIPTVTRTFIEDAQFNVNPIPFTWTDTVDNRTFNNGLYSITSVAPSDGNIVKVFDRNENTAWQLPSGRTSDSVAIALPQEALVTKMKIKQTGSITSITIYGGNNNIGEIGTNVFSKSSPSYPTLTEITLSGTTKYKYYTLFINRTNTSTPSIFEFQISQLTLATYTNKYVINGLPNTFTTNQRVLIEIPNTTNTFGTVSNTLNDIGIDTVLQPNKRYELVYNGTSFNATEV